jgi:hypothetical protein
MDNKQIDKFTDIQTDIHTHLTITILVELFKQRVNELVLLHSVIMPDGKVMIKGGAVYDLLKDLIEYQKQVRLDKAYDDVKNTTDKNH